MAESAAFELRPEPGYEALGGLAMAFLLLRAFSSGCAALTGVEAIIVDDEDVDYIENFDFFDSDWIKTGFKEERLIYRHWFNERTQKKLFYGSYEIQRRLGITREVPSDIQVMIGSQWWCLRRQTVEKVLAFCVANQSPVLKVTR